MTAEEQIIADLDALTKQGQRLQVLKVLARLLKDGPSQSLRPQLARIANRNQAYVQALRILHPLIRDDREDIAPTTSEALNIYATSLMWIGALEESQQCLERIKGSTDALLTEAFVYFAQWDYQKSIPVLLKYVGSPQINPYQNLVGRINLLAAYTAIGNIAQAKDVFAPLIVELKANPNYKLLYGNCLELRAQIEIIEKSYETALAFLSESQASLDGQPSRYLLYVNKWRAIAQLGLFPGDVSARCDLLGVKNEALKLKNWETIRDCDFHLARLNQDQDGLQRILLGTPYHGYHQRIESLFGITMQFSKDLEYCPGNPLEKPDRRGLDLNSISDNSFLNSTSWPLLQLITKDIYRPPRMGVVFNHLYRGEYFNPFTSPQRVRNSIFRFNEWAENQTCEFRIKISDGEFQLVGPNQVSILTRQRERPVESWRAALSVFKNKNQSRSFTTADVGKALGITPRSALVILQKALKSRKIQKLGCGKSTRYIFFSGRRAA